MTNTLYLNRIAVSDPLALHRFARQIHLPDHPFDPDYVFHCILVELFGSNCLKPFLRDPRRRGVAVMGYSALDSQALHEKAQAFAPPEVYRLINWDACASKPLPKRWHVGYNIGFRVRVCPMVRGPKGHGNYSEIRKEEPEVDAYLAQAWQKKDAPSREFVYSNWLRREITRYNAVELQSARMTMFRLIKCLRYDRERTAKTITRPDAIFKGIFTIKNSEAFVQLLTRGLGRHRAFGFGMLLLIPQEEQ